MDNKIQDIYPLSPTQEGMLYHVMLNPEARDYFAQMELKITGSVQAELLQESMDVLMARYDILRAMFIYDKVKRPMQIILKECRSPIHFEKLMHLSEEEQRDYVVAYRQKDQLRGVELNKAPLIRFAFFQVGEEECWAYLTLHHIIMDGWSSALILEEFAQIYRSLYQGRSIELEKTYPYSGFLNWIKSQDKAQGLAYYQQYLKGYESPVSVPPLAPAKNSPVRQEVQEIVFTPEVYAKITELARSQQVTINSIFQAAWGLLLQRYNSTTDAVFGAVVTTRPTEVMGITKMVGIFINTIPVRVTGGPKTFLELSKEVQKAAYDGEKYNYLSLAEIQAATPLKQNLIDHILVFENYPAEKKVPEISGLTVQKVKTYEQTSYDLSVEIYPGAEILVKFIYNPGVYDAQGIQRTAGHFHQLVKTVANQPELTLDAIDILPEQEKEQMFSLFSGRKMDFARTKTVYHFLEEMAAASPERPALVFAGTVLSYGELNQRVNQLAQFLRAKGVGKESLVGVLLDRSPAMVESILAIWKAGGAYIPLDTAYPVNRLCEILQDANAGHVITENAGLIAGYQGEVIVPGVSRELISKEESLDLCLEYQASDLAYVIYTSGSTGKPKGAMVEHLGMMNHMHAKIADLALDGDCVIAQNASHCFDISVWQFFVALVTGGRTVIYPKDLTLDPERFVQKLQADGVTILEVVPSFLSVMLEHLAGLSVQLREFKDLKFLLITGEELKIHLVRKWFDLYPAIKLVNAYGPTEASDDITHYILDTVPAVESVPIGKPLPNFNIYIVDATMRLCPIGVKGEICVSGIGVGRGYLNNPDKTREVFTFDPFTGEAGRRLYKTGDLGRYLPDGNIEFFGRKDYQVKIRGFRIELGEIENWILKYPAVKAAVVLDRTDREGVKYLCGFYTAGQEVNVSALQQFLQEHLPYYMVPGYLLQLPVLPLNPNGKIDRKALPEVEGSAEVREYIGPRSHNEEVLTAIWAEVLGLPKIGINDNFFALGGHSLKATQVIARIRKEWNTGINLQALFKYPTIAELAAVIEERTSLGGGKILPLPEQEYYATSYAQQRMWLHSSLDGSGTLYNILTAHALQGELDVAAFTRAYQELVARHETLRTIFQMNDGNLKQRIIPEVSPEVIYRDMRGKDWKVLMAEELTRRFDLEHGPLVRGTLLWTQEGEHIFLFALHHLITDGWSLGILLRDLFTLYAAYVQNQPSPLPPVALQYKDFAAWQNGLLESGELRLERNYWLEVFQGEIPVLHLPTDRPRPAEKTYQAEKLAFALEPETSRGLVQICQQQNVTPFMALVATVGVLLFKYSGQKQLVIGTDIVGRNREELEQVNGLFINTLALKLNLDPALNFTGLLQKVKEVVIGAFDHQNYPFDQLVADLRLKRDPGRSPLFDVMVSLNNIGSELLPVENLRVTQLPVESKTTYFDLLFAFTEEKETLTGRISYTTDLFDRKYIELMQVRLLTLLGKIIASPETAIAQLDYTVQVEQGLNEAEDVDFDL